MILLLLRGLALIAILGLTPWHAHAQAKRERLLTTEKPLIINLAVTKPTSIVLPQPIAFIGVLQRPDLYSINWHGPYLYVYAFDATLDSQLFVVDQLGEQYTIFFRIASPADVVVRIAPPSPKQLQAPPVSVASWLRILDGAQAPLPGAVPVDLAAPNVQGETRLAVEKVAAVSAGTMIGAILTVHNQSAAVLSTDLQPAPGPERLALEEWLWPPRLRVQALAFASTAPAFLEPGQQARLYVVLERRDH